jgi:MFS family permease
VSKGRPAPHVGCGPANVGTRRVPPLSARRATALGAGTTVAYMLPVFLVGALAVPITAELGFGDVGLGSAVGVYYAAMALASIPLGRAVDRVGALRAMRLSAVASAIATLGIAALAGGWPLLAFLLLFGGIAGALGQPSSNRLLSRRVPPERLATAFGLKQSAPPIASLLAGLSVPAFATLLGWRAAFVAAGAAALLLAVAVGRPARPVRQVSAGRDTTRLRDRPTLLALAVGLGCAFAANSSVLAFYVVAAVDAGTPEARAGILYATASLAAIASRVVAGLAVDRRSVRPLRLCTISMVCGAAGSVALAVPTPAVMAVAVVVALVGTWGFNSVFWYAAVSAYAETPGRVTGVLAPAALGGTIGPILFGSIAAIRGYPTAWLTTAALALAGAGAMQVAATRLRGGTAPDGPP